ncbi:MAG: hypothetical protein AAGF02_10185 [Actinomycetota bacterium]
MTAARPTPTGTVPATPADALVATVAYSDVFDMPVSVDQVHPFLVGHRVDADDLPALIDQVVAAGRLGRRADLLYLPGREDVLDVHVDRTARADVMWPTTIRWARRIGRLPLVRAVAVWGGLAVDWVADHDDADLFLVVAPGRLWLTRLLVLVLVRLAERDDIELCPNYIVSESAIEMDDRELYVARELAQMLPIVGAERCIELRRRNAWMFDHLPNATVEGDLRRVDEVGAPGPVRRAAEWLLALPIVEPLERWEMRRKVDRLRAVRSRRPEVGAPDESSFSRDVCKGHMVGNAAGIDVAWNERRTAARA